MENENQDEMSQPQCDENYSSIMHELQDLLIKLQAEQKMIDTDDLIKLKLFYMETAMKNKMILYSIREMQMRENGDSSLSEVEPPAPNGQNMEQQ